jgi:hypothetical protein
MSNMKKKISTSLGKAILSIGLIFSLFFPTLSHAFFPGVGTGSQGTGQIQFGGTLSNILACSGITPQAVVGFAGNLVGEIFPGSPWAQAADELANGNLVGAVTGAVSQAQTVPVTDGAVGESAAETEENTRWQVFKEQCLDKIARDLAIRAMNRITIATVEWINGGFAKGGPMFISNPEQFFGDIAREEFAAFGLQVNMLSSGGPGDFWPSILTNVENTYRRRFTNRMQNSFNQVLMNTNATYQDWVLNFSVGGGWNSYFAFVQPNNNVFGAWIETNRHLNSRLAGTFVNAPALSIEQEIIANNGFLSSRECVATLYSNQGDGGYIKGNDPLHIPAGTPPITGFEQVPDAFVIYSVDNNLNTSDQALVAFAEEYRQRSVCTRWEIVTPGAFVRDSLSSALIDTPRDQLTSSKELNDNIGLLFDSLVLAAFNGITRGLNPNNPDNPLNQVAENPNFGNEFIINNNFNPYVDAGGSPVSSGGGVGSISVSQAISNQQEYIQALNGSVTATNNIITAIRSLDYCVPGPNPYWITDSANTIQSILNEASDFFGSPAQAQSFFAEQLAFITGLSIDPLVANITTFSQFESIVSDIFDQYSFILGGVYPLTEPPPTMRVVAANYYEQKRELHIPNVSILNQEIADATSKLNQLTQLQTILASVDPESPAAQAIENQIQSIQGIATEGLIAATDVSNLNLQNLLSSINLLVTQCIAEVSNPQYAGLVGRVTYPHPLNQLVQSLPTEPFTEITIGLTDADIVVDILPEAILNIESISIQVFEDVLGVIY